MKIWKRVRRGFSGGFSVFLYPFLSVKHYPFPFRFRFLFRAVIFLCLCPGEMFFSFLCPGEMLFSFPCHKEILLSFPCHEEILFSCLYRQNLGYLWSLSPWREAVKRAFAEVEIYF